MSNRTLAQLAAAQVPSVQLEFMTPPEKMVLNFEILPYIKHFGRVPLGRRTSYTQVLLNVCQCNDCGNCLCYLDYVKNLSLDVWWGSPDDFATLNGWISFPN